MIWERVDLRIGGSLIGESNLKLLKRKSDLEYIESGMAYCGVHDFLDRSKSFELDNYLEDDFPEDVEKWWDYIWLEEEVEAERAYQKEQAL